MNEAQQIEDYLLNRLTPAYKLLFEAQMLVDENLQGKVAWQKRGYELVKAYGRKRLHEDIEAAHKKLFSEKRFESFRQKVSKIFR